MILNTITNKDFYPTPLKLINKMISKIDINFDDRILEPSAGSGSIVDALKEKYRYRDINNIVDCIEKDENLQATLIGKGHKLIDSDFLSYVPSKQYDTIIMNPPFSNGVKHVLKAWEIIYNGDVIALLNAETIRNPYSGERKLLENIIKENGEVEFIQDAFIYAERKTKVEIALIHLKKRQSIKKDYFTGMKQSSNVNEPGVEKNELAIPTSQIENSVIAYNKAIECKKESIIKEREANYYSSMIRSSNSQSSEKEITQQTKNSLNDYIDELREAAWRDVMHMADFRRHLTDKVMKEIDSQFETVKKLEFTESNIRKFLSNLIFKQEEIINECILEVFDNFTRYYPENRVHIEGWKSNDVFFVGRRVVLPWMVSPNFDGETMSIRYEKENEFMDIDKVIKIVMGEKDTLSSSLGFDGQYMNRKKIIPGKLIESKFCKIRFYKKGTAHFYFDKKFIDRFNILVGKYRSWLPESDDQIPKEFWLMNAS